MFTLIFIILFVAVGLRMAFHYPTRLQLAYNETAIAKGDYYRFFTAIFDNQNWIGVVFAALNLFFLLAMAERTIGVLPSIILVLVLTIIPYYINYKFRIETDFHWGSLPLIFGLFVYFTAVQPLMSIQIMFILPLNYIVFSGILLALIIYNQIKQKVPISSLCLAFSGVTALFFAAIFEFSNVKLFWWSGLSLLIALGVIFAFSKNEFTNRPKRAKVIKMNIDHHYNVQKQTDQERLNALLDKISSKGMSSLNKEEKKFLEEYSKK